MKKLKRLLTLVICAAMLLSLAACGPGKQTEPNTGLYKALFAEMFEIEMSVTDIFPQGFTIELYDKGKCKLSIDGKSANGKWTLDGSAFTVKGGGLDCAGELDTEEGVIYLLDVLGMGVSLVFYSEALMAQLDEMYADFGGFEAAMAETSLWADEYDYSEDDYDYSEDDYSDYTEDADDYNDYEDESDDSSGVGDYEFEAISVPSSWYGMVYSEALDYVGDIWAKVDTTGGKTYFEAYETIEEYYGYDSAADISPIMSMFIDEEYLYLGVMPIADGEAWFFDHYITEDEVWAFTGIPFDGMLVFDFEFADEDGMVIDIELYLRENGAAWDEENDPLPPSYEDYKNGF